MFGLIIGALSLVFIDPLVKLLSNATMTEYTKNYFKYIIYATPFMTASFTLSNQLRFQGSAIHGMLGLGIGAVLNIALDPVLIEITGGVQGASLATMICQIISFGILFAMTFFGNNIRIKLKNFKISLAQVVEITRGGAPSLLRQGMSSVATVVLTLLVKPYGDFAIAGVSIAQKIAWILFSILLGFGQGFQPVCGFNYGAQKYDRVKKAFWFTVMVGTAYMFVAGLVTVLFAEPLVSFFNTSDNGLTAENMQKAVDVGVKVLRWQGFAFPLMGFYVASNMMMQNIGKPVRASVLALCRQGVVFIPILFIMNATLRLTGIILAQSVADLISFIIAIPLLISVLREINALENLKKDGSSTQ